MIFKKLIIQQLLFLQILQVSEIIYLQILLRGDMHGLNKFLAWMKNMAFGEFNKKMKCTQASDCAVHPTIHSVRERLERLGNR